MTDAKSLYLDLMKRSLLNLLYNEAEAEIKRFDREERLEGREWPALAHTMIGLKRLDNLQYCVEDVLRQNIPGDLIETGVWRGGALIFMRSVLKAHGVTDKQVWGADSFAGFPPPNGEKYPADANIHLHQCKELSVSLEQVKSNFEKYGLLDDQVHFLPGWFSETLTSAPLKQFCLVRLDSDLYQSTMLTLEILYPKLSSGGYLIVDDYGIPCCREAVNDYRAEHHIDEEIIPVDWTGAYWRKL